MASIQEALSSLRQEIDSQQSKQLVVQDETPYDSLPPYLLHGHSERIRQLRISDSSSAWDDLDSIPVASLPAKFRILDIERGDLVLRVIGGLIRDPRGKFRPSWSGPYFIKELTPEGAAWLMDLDGNRFSKPTNVD
ncbi:hypothetical protein CK203_055523 [Vitis vinifera]|uniref:Uncharacterized protein n=1 Tax=Vitis vinifera TaxID=29760 RepID=A0A438FKT8_VITVI|nr:hypothetical protein CK203_055523 [Vitis vinifera]